MKKLILFSILALAIITSCKEKSQPDYKEKSQPETQVQKFINPPFNHISVPSTEYTVNAEKGDTVFYSSGSFVIFPPNSFVDENSKVIKGKVKVLYREFNNPIDFFLSGIPMNYDSSGVSYNFESMGMVEIYATQNGRPLQVNKENQPTVNLASNINNGANNYYYLDTINENWVYKNKTEITDILDASYNKSIGSIESNQELIKPRKKSNRPSFHITIEPGSVPELSAYDNLRFEITEYEKNYKPEYGDILWENVKVEKGQRKGTYDVTFLKKDKRVTFETWPVLSDAEYDKAIASYNRKKKKYDSKREKEVFELKRKRIEEYNAVIKTHSDSIKRAVEAYRNRVISENQIRKRNAEITKFVYSKFSIDKFGIWNCDEAILQQGKRLNTNFYSDGTDKIGIEEFSVIYYDLNGIIKEFDQLTYIQNNKMKIVAIKDSSFYYSTYDDFINYSIDTTKNTINIKLIKNDIPKNYKDLCNNVKN